MSKKNKAKLNKEDELEKNNPDIINISCSQINLYMKK